MPATVAALASGQRRLTYIAAQTQKTIRGDLLGRKHAASEPRRSSFLVCAFGIVPLSTSIVLPGTFTQVQSELHTCYHSNSEKRRAWIGKESNGRQWPIAGNKKRMNGLEGGTGR